MLNTLQSSYPRGFRRWIIVFHGSGSLIVAVHMVNAQNNEIKGGTPRAIWLLWLCKVEKFPWCFIYACDDPTMINSGTIYPHGAAHDNCVSDLNVITSVGIHNYSVSTPWIPILMNAKIQNRKRKTLTWAETMTTMMTIPWTSTTPPTSLFLWFFHSQIY